jgi:hypothetical protein
MAAHERAALLRTVPAHRTLEGSETPPAGGVAASNHFRAALPFLAAATIAALLLLIPGVVVPRERMSDVLEGHGADFTLAAFIGVALFFALRFLG